MNDMGENKMNKKNYSSYSPNSIFKLLIINSLLEEFRIIVGISNK